MTTYHAQTRAPHSNRWITTGHSTTPYKAAETMRNRMQIAGFRYSELASHCEDLAAGETLTAEDGRTFQVRAAE